MQDLCPYYIFLIIIINNNNKYFDLLILDFSIALLLM